jgi:hypothetical protein
MMSGFPPVSIIVELLSKLRAVELLVSSKGALQEVQIALSGASVSGIPWFCFQQKIQNAIKVLGDGHPLKHEIRSLAGIR